MNQRTTRSMWLWTVLLGISALTVMAIFSARQATALAGGANPGDVIINEIMQNPSAVSDGSGEWLELYNTTASPINLQNWVISDNDTDSHVITSSLIISANSYLVLGNNADSGTNGGVNVAYSYGSSWFLSNGSDEVVITDGVTEIDRVEYDNGATFPDPNGASMALIDPALDNNVGSNWCTATTAYGDGDLGTPGSANDCPAPSAELSVVKDGPATAVSGETLVYDVTVANNGTLDATNVMLTDTLPVSTTFVSSDLGVPTMTGNMASWSLGTVATSANNSYQITVTLDSSLGTGAVLTNTVMISTDEATDDPSDNMDTAVTTITGSASGIAINKTAVPFGMIGTPFTYTVSITNNATITAQNVIFTDTFPVGVSYVGDDSGIIPTDMGNNTYSWALGNIPTDTSVTVALNVLVSDTLTNGTTLTNTAMVGTDNAGTSVSLSASTFYTMVSIYDIQTVVDPSVDDASPLAGQIVWTEGIVTAEPGEIDSNTRLMYIQDMAGGAWSGLAIFRSSNFPEIYPEGTYVRVLGTVDEAFGATTQLNLSGTPWAVEVMGSTMAPTPEQLTTAEFSDSDASISEQWESVLVRFNDATVTDDDLGFSEWYFNDGSGDARADDFGDRDGDLTYTPTNGEEYAFIRGIAGFSFGNYKLYPRYDADIAVITGAPTFGKTAVENITTNSLYTYTISLANTTGYTLTGVVVTDTIPAGAEFAFTNGAGVFDGTTIEWNFVSIPMNENIELTFAVTATADSGAIINDDYAVTASNYPTPTFGLPVVTTIGGSALPTYAIQGDGIASDLEGATVTTYGIVTGFFEGNSGEGDFDGFFIQDPVGDGDTATSDGLFVDYGSLNITVSVGDWVTVTGEVQEYSEYDDSACPIDEGCLTQVEVNSTGDVVVAGTGSITAVTLDPPGDPMLSDLYFESLEGMLVTIPNTATVVGPTSFGTIQVIPGDAGVDRVFHGGPNEGLPVGVRHYEKFGDINGVDPDGLITGSIIENADGPLTFSYSNYLITTQEGDAWSTVFNQPAPTTLPELPAPAANQFSVATFNTLNFDGGDDATKFTKVVNAIDQLNGPTFVALQEINVEVMTTILADLSNLGYAYDYANSHPDIGNHGVALIWRTDQVSNITVSTAYQGCSEFGSGSATGYDNYCDGTGLLPTFSRRPVVLTGTVSMAGTDQQLVIIANHFKSKLGGAPSDARRLAQAELVAGIVDNVVGGGVESVIVLGDLNDFEDSPPLEALYATGNLTTTWNMVPADERYSYIFSGVSQILDHILVSPALYTQLEDVRSLHVNADFPFNPFTNDDSTIIRVSDHELVGAIFNEPVATANLKVAHVAPFGNDNAFGGGTAVNIHIDGTEVLTNVVFGDSTAYMAVPAGDHLVEIYPVGSSTPAISATVYLTKEMDFTAVAIGDGVNQPLELLLLEDVLSPSPAGANLRIGHLAPFSSVLTDTLVTIMDESTGNPIPGLQSIPYKTVSDFFFLPAGTYDLVVTTPDGSVELIDPEPVTIGVGDVLTVFAVGGANGNDLGLLALTGNAGTLADLLPLETDYMIFLPFVTRDS